MKYKFEAGKSDVVAAADDDDDVDDDWSVECINVIAQETVELLGSEQRNRNSADLLRPDDGNDDGEDHGSDPARVSGAGEGTRSGFCPVLSPGVRVSLAAAMAAVGGVLFGYDTGVISGALLQLRAEFQLTCQQSEIVVSALLLGALLASLCGGFLVDFCGRKETIIVNDVAFLVGTVILAAAHNYPTLVVGRLIVGFAVSLSATAECIYIAEISPAKRRGLLVSLNELGITVGFLLAYIFNYAFITVHSGWRYMFSVGAVLAVLQAVGMAFLPPSPRYFVLRGKNQQARVVLQSLLHEDEVDDEFSRIVSSVNEERRRSWTSVCCGADNICRMFLIAIPLLLLQQLTGQATVLYYAPMLFQEVGFRSNTAAVLATVGLGVVKVVVTLVYLVLTSRVGRRTLLLVGTSLMLLGTVALGFCIRLFFHDQRFIASTCNAASLAFTNSSMSDSVMSTYSLPSLLSDAETLSSIIGQTTLSLTTTTATVDSSSTLGSFLALISLLLFVAGYSVGFGPGTWLLLSELFPSHIKGRAIAMSTCFNWGTNLVISVTFLDFLSSVGSSIGFWIYGVVCVVALLFIGLFVPETKDRSLEDINTDLLEQQQRRHQCLRKFCWFGCKCCTEHRAGDDLSAAITDAAAVHTTSSRTQDTTNNGSAVYELIYE